jgi:enamine deaminase RidA (YjgF/YER057c/UK114 family)
MERKVVNPWKWQEAFGFVQGNLVKSVQNLLCCAGQVPVDQDGNPVHAGDMAAQIGLAFDNLEAVLIQAGGSLSDVVQTTYYTTDVQAFGEAGAVLGRRLDGGNCRPASTLVGVASLFHPDVLFEVQAVAMF